MLDDKQMNKEVLGNDSDVSARETEELKKAVAEELFVEDSIDAEDFLGWVIKQASKDYSRTNN